VTDADLEEVTETIWGTLFEFPLERSGPVAGRDTDTDTDATVTSVVHIDGAWHGAVVLRCPMALATTLTSAMFQTAEPGTDDIRDALGELANMTAGNVKALLPEPCGISLPTVAFGLDYQLDVVGTVAIATANFTCAGQLLVVTLLRRSRREGGT